ncbi:MAG: hypothetical protein MZU79_02880 [Anaerotruncus sp.]|nr:hypothetical protein [Anaerotruncus sp.]
MTMSHPDRIDLKVLDRGARHPRLGPGTLPPRPRRQTFPALQNLRVRFRLRRRHHLLRPQVRRPPHRHPALHLFRPRRPRHLAGHHRRRRQVLLRQPRPAQRPAQLRRIRRPP